MYRELNIRDRWTKRVEQTRKGEFQDGRFNNKEIESLYLLISCILLFPNT